MRSNKFMLDAEVLSKLLSEKDLSNMAYAASYGPKYSSGSSVYTDQSIINPNSNELTYCIASIIQAEIFEHFGEAEKFESSFPDLIMTTSLPTHLGGPLQFIPKEMLDRETADDPELREMILNGSVPTIDTILRFITWVFQSVKYTAQCNIIAFVYLKRIISSKRMLTIRNWRALWIGAIIVAQKFIDDVCVRTSSFCEILPGVSRQQLKAVELCVFELMDYCGRIKPSVYAQFFFELRMIFEAITGQMVAQRITNFSAQCPPLRPLSREQGNALIEEPAIPRRGRTVSQSDASENNSSISGGAGPETSEFRLPPTSSRASSVTATTAGVKQSSTAHSDAVTRLPPLASVKQQHKPRQQSGSSRSSRSSKGHNKKERSITADDIHYALSKGVFIIN